MCTGNENSKPIWNKFIIRKDIIETSQVVLNFCRTVYITTILKPRNLFPPAIHRLFLQSLDSNGSMFSVKNIVRGKLNKQIDDGHQNTFKILLIHTSWYQIFINVKNVMGSRPHYLNIAGGRSGHDHMVVGFTTTSVISAYHN